MNYILNYNEFGNSNHQDSMNENFRETLKNFEDSILQKIKNIGGKKKETVAEDIVKTTVDKVKNLSDEARRAKIRFAVSALISLAGINFAQNFIEKSSAPKEFVEMAEENLNIFKKADQFKMNKHGVSEQGVNHIKKFEGYRENVYALGDGKLTVGWGHAEDRKTTKLKKGQKITKQQAEEYFKEDLKEASDGVKRIFKDWEEENIEVKITQSMFDALVSLAYNCGVTGLREGIVIRLLKKSDYDGAGKAIENFKVRKKFPGLKTRRKAEMELYFKDIKKLEKIFNYKLS